MAKTFLVPVDLNKNELQNARVQNLSTAPATPVTGQLYYDTDDNTLYWWNGTAWTAAKDAGGTGQHVIKENGTPLTARAGLNFVSGIVATDDVGNDETDVDLDWGEIGDIDAITFGQSTGAGSLDEVARADHAHGMATIADGDIPATIMRDAEHTTASHQEMLSTADLTDWPRTAALDFNNQKITGLGTPTLDTDAATKLYVDGLSQGIAWKETVRVATTAAGTLATGFENTDTIDGVALVTGDRILIKDQAAGQENGIYIVNVSGAPTRATDADTAADILQSAVFVQEGTANADSAWVMTTNAPITLGTTPLAFVQFSGLGQITAGNGLTKSGNTIDAVGGTGIVANANDLAVLRTDANGRVPLKYAASFGDGAAVSYNIDHNLNSLDVIVEVFRNSDGVKVECDVTHSTVNRVILAFAVAPTSNQYRVVVYG